MTTPFETTAGELRTGYVFCVPEDYRTTLEIDYPVRGRCTDPATGETFDGVAFTGWANTGSPVDRGWPLRLDTRVLVLTDLGDQECGFQSLL